MSRLIFLMAALIFWMWFFVSMAASVIACRKSDSKGFLVVYILERMVGLVVSTQVLFYLIRNW